jgi:hypothetical protein
MGPCGCACELDYEPGQISTWHAPITRIACAHSVVPFGHTWQMSGTGKFGHGSVTGGGPASTHTVAHARKPDGSQEQLSLQPSGPPPDPHPDPGLHGTPGLQPSVGHVVPHWKWPVPSHMQDVEHPELPWITLPQPLPGMQAAPWVHSSGGGGFDTGQGNSSTHS